MRILSNPPFCIALFFFSFAPRRPSPMQKNNWRPLFSKQPPTSHRKHPRRPLSAMVRIEVPGVVAWWHGHHPSFPPRTLQLSCPKNAAGINVPSYFFDTLIFRLLFGPCLNSPGCPRNRSREKHEILVREGHAASRSILHHQQLLRSRPTEHFLDALMTMTRGTAIVAVPL